MTEQWKPVKGYEGFYEVSNYGNVRSLTRLVRSGKNRVRYYKSQIIAHQINRKGYIFVQIYKNGIRKKHFIHRLVAEAFIEKEQGKPYVNHLNGVKFDNTICNLEWITHIENVRHYHREIKEAV